MLHACSHSKAVFHDVQERLPHISRHELLHTAEALRAMHCIEIYIKRNYLYTRITEEGLQYLRALEKHIAHSNLQQALP